MRRWLEALIECLRALDDWELETLATVHSVASQLPNDNITAQAVMDAIKADHTWRAKLTRPNFTAKKIRNALQELARLRLL